MKFGVDSGIDICAISISIFGSQSPTSHFAHPSRDPRPDPSSDAFSQKSRLLSEAIPFIFCRHASQRVLSTETQRFRRRRPQKLPTDEKTYSPKWKNEKSTPNLIHASLLLETPADRWFCPFFQLTFASIPFIFCRELS